MDEEYNTASTKALDEEEISIIKSFNRGPYADSLKNLEKEINDLNSEIISLTGVQESDTGLAPVSEWDLEADKQLTQRPPLIVSRVTKAIKEGPKPRYIISIQDYARFVVEEKKKEMGLGMGTDQGPKLDINDGDRVAVERSQYQIVNQLPPSEDPSVSVMQVEEKPDVTYKDIGGCDAQI